ncbi:bifunctional riboflavin kinase/FAD synthetase [Flavobacterium sp. N1719]|uniref:bifunctional riboflavin kinase/FAD synthetase n=1 Tax=Flavobacterium sp. N1719 TaxID=2885633 RepID=UPI002222CE29|nr:bifunctional riboflavin kinase/FAD synthetase [Flavobacterium sp. N1719]
METFFNIAEFPTSKGTVVTLGTFDGVHLGHQKIIKKLTESAQKMALKSLVLTFHPHPRTVLQDSSSLQLLNTIEEKKVLLAHQNIDILVIHPFDKEFSRLTAEEFVVDVLVKKFNVKKIIIGYDHRFGRNRTATIEDLIHFGAVHGFEVEQISAEEINEITISSTKIREALHQGNIKVANDYLGYNYTLSGTVVQGQQIGRTIGFPTANIAIETTEKLIPCNGVYIAFAHIDNKKYEGVMNIGNRPTVNGQSQSIEIHLFDFNTSIYGEKITLELIEYIRPEQKFEDLNALKLQIAKDKQIATDYFLDAQS